MIGVLDALRGGVPNIQEAIMANISRRSFLATSAAAAAVATVPAIAMAGDNPTYDVIVIGGGGAGLSAAIEASDAGASVLVLEKNTVTGGTTSTSQGLIGGFGTQIQKAQGVELTYEQMYSKSPMLVTLSGILYVLSFALYVIIIVLSALNKIWFSYINDSDSFTKEPCQFWYL